MTRSIVLTGASSGIGAALALAYAGPEARLLLIGRDPVRLADVAVRARALGADVETATVDVADRAGMKRLLLAFDEAGPVDTVIANAGVAIGRAPNGLEPPGAAQKLVEINLIGMLNTVEPLLPRLLRRGAGRVALVSSIAARRPSADLPTYSATKAAIRAYGEAIRSGLRRRGVAVTVICPGFVTSPMSRRHQGPKLFEIPAPKAARIMRRAIEARRGRLTFPWPWAFLLFWEAFLPARISDWFERRSAAEIVRED